MLQLTYTHEQYWEIRIPKQNLTLWNQHGKSQFQQWGSGSGSSSSGVWRRQEQRLARYYLQSPSSLPLQLTKAERIQKLEATVKLVSLLFMWLLLHKSKKKKQTRNLIKLNADWPHGDRCVVLLDFLFCYVLRSSLYLFSAFCFAFAIRLFYWQAIFCAPLYTWTRYMGEHWSTLKVIANRNTFTPPTLNCMCRNRPLTLLQNPRTPFLAFGQYFIHISQAFLSAYTFCLTAFFKYFYLVYFQLTSF